MSKLVTKTTSYAPDIFRALDGLLLVCKPPKFHTRALMIELRERISESLNQYKQRPISKRLQIEGDIGAEKRIVEAPNLADHPLVAGPRYMPWEVKMSNANPNLPYRSSGLEVLILGEANKYYNGKLRLGQMISVYHITGKFGHVTDTFFEDGKIIDKTTFHHIRPHKIDGALARIESSQQHRLYDSAAVPLNSQAAYELAKNWPSRPANMAQWPVIYRVRCIHLKLPIFKLEVTCVNENELFLAHIVNDLGQMLKSGAHTQMIKRVKLGPFDLNDSLTDKDWNLQSILNHLKVISSDHQQLHKTIREHVNAIQIRTEYTPKYLESPAEGSSEVQRLTNR